MIQRQQAGRSWVEKMGATLLLALFVALLYYPLLFTNRVLASGDILLYFYPYRDYAAASLRSGQVPLWNPFLFLGAPFLANPQTAVLYPLHWPLIWLPVAKQIYWSAAIHTWILGFGGYVLLRRWHYDAGAALITGLVLAGSGFYGGLFGHINQMNAAAWLPWSLVVYEGPSSTGRGRIRQAAFFALLVALMVLAGHTQTVYINLFGLGVWLFLRSFGLLHWQRWRPKLIFAPAALIVYIAGGLLGGLLVAAQLLPTLEINRLGLRSGGLDYLGATSFSLKPLLLFWSLLPSYGLRDLSALFASPGYSEYIAYVGALGFALACGAIYRLRHWPNAQANQQQLGLIGGAVFALLGLTLALGRWNPFYYLLYQTTPGFDLFRAPARWLMLYTMGMALLAGIGFAQLREWSAAKFTARSVRLMSPAVILLVAVDLLAAARSLPHTQTTAPQAVYDVRTAPAFLLTDPARQQTSAAAMGRFLGMSTITYDPGDMEDFRRILRQGVAPQLDERAFEQLVIALKVQELMVPNLPLLWRIPSADGFDGGVLPLQRYNRFVSLFIPPDALVPDGRLREQLHSPPPAALLDLMDVRYLVTDKVRDLWFEDVFYDRQFGQRMTNRSTDGAASRYIFPHLPVFEATHLDLIAAIEGEPEELQPLFQRVQEVAEVHVVGSQATDRAQHFTLTAGGGAAPLADSALDSPLARSSGATTAYRDVAGGKQEYRVRLAFSQPTQPHSIVVQLLPNAPDLVMQAATLYDARTRMFQPLDFEARLVHSGDVKIYQLDNKTGARLGRAYMVSNVRAAGDLEAAEEMLRNSQIDPRQSAIVEGLTPDHPLTRQNPASPSAAKIVRYEAERVEITIDVAQQSLLVLSDAFYPGWTATIDGAATAIYPTNALFRGVVVPPGKHTVIFRFTPPLWRQGALLSAAGLALWLVIFGISLRFGRSVPGKV